MIVSEMILTIKELMKILLTLKRMTAVMMKLYRVRRNQLLKESKSVTVSVRLWNILILRSN